MSKPSGKNTYDAKDITVLEGLEPVQKRPGMYTDTSTPSHLAMEVIDNSVDEAIAGHADRIFIILHEDGAISVEDNGRGMPVDNHPTHNRPAVEIILTTLHAGGKFNSDNYQYSGGLHGVGISVVNALSSSLVAEAKRGGWKHRIEFANGLVSKPLVKTDRVEKDDTGTIVKFTPDPKYFDEPRVDLKRLGRALQAKAVLCPGLAVTLANEAKGTEEQFFYPNGMEQYLRERAELEQDHALLMVERQDSSASEGVTDHGVLDVGIAWGSGHASCQESYVNLIPTPSGGTHVNGLRAALVGSVTAWAEAHGTLPRGLKIAPEDCMSGTSFVLSYKMDDPQFAGQTKERLSSRDAAQSVLNAARNKIEPWFAKNPDKANAITAAAIERALERTRSAKAIERKKVTRGPALPGKLVDCSESGRERSELFLVEGDSAGGSAKQARNRDFQAILPLRGKILNTWQEDSRQVLKSKEIHDIAVAMGVDPLSEDIEGLRYNKICILADADSDGFHIATLFCALMIKHFPAVVRAGHVFVALPPLYRVDIGKEKHYALTAEERDAIIAKEARRTKTKPTVTRFKGLGEMNPAQLRITTMDPDTRRMIQLTYEPDRDDETFDMLLNKNRASELMVWLKSGGPDGANAPGRSGSPASASG